MNNSVHHITLDLDKQDSMEYVTVRQGDTAKSLSAMLTESGRRDWHGKSTTWIDTNACIRVWRYEDGFEWTEPWARPKSDIEKAMERAAAKVAQAERSARGKPATVADIITGRARTEAMILTNGVETVVNEITVGP